MATSSPTSKHELLCSEEDLQFYALNMLHDLAHDYMEDPLPEGQNVCDEKGNIGNGYELIAREKGIGQIEWATIRANTKPVEEETKWFDTANGTNSEHRKNSTKDWNMLVAQVEKNLSDNMSGCIPTQTPPATIEQKNKLIIDIIEYFKPRILDNETPQSGLLKNQNDTLDTIVRNINSKTTNCDTDMLNNVVKSMTGVDVVPSPLYVGTPGTTLQKDINTIHKNKNKNNTCDYLIDNAKNNDTPVHKLEDHTFCPLSSSMDGKANSNDVCKDVPNVSKIRSFLQPGKKIEKGNMLIKLYTENKNYIVLKRNHVGNNMHLTAKFKFGTFYFESTMSIMSLNYASSKQEDHNINYIINVNNQIIEKTINYSILDRKDLTNINLTSNNIYEKALKNIENEEGDNRKIIAYGTLIFKSFGDILQEWNGVLNSGGYDGPIKYTNDSTVCKYIDGQPLRVILSKDKLSAARILWSLFKGKEKGVWKENINKNCFGGYVNKHLFGYDYKIYNPGKNTLYKYCVPSSPDIGKSPSEGDDNVSCPTKSLNEDEESTNTDRGGRGRGRGRGRGDRGNRGGRGGRGRGRGRGRGATGGASTIQQETYQDPLTYAIVAIGAFAAMMIGLQK